MSGSSIIDDLANKRHLPQVLALAGEGEVSLERLRRPACGSATHGTSRSPAPSGRGRSSICLSVAAGSSVARTGVFVFVLADELPTATAALDRALGWRRLGWPRGAVNGPSRTDALATRSERHR